MITVQKIWKTGGVGVVARGAGEVAVGIERVGASPDRMPGNSGKAGNHVGLRGCVLVAGNTEVRGIEAEKINLVRGVGIVTGCAVPGGSGAVQVFPLAPVILMAGRADLFIGLTDRQLAPRSAGFVAYGA